MHNLDYDVATRGRAYQSSGTARKSKLTVTAWVGGVTVDGVTPAEVGWCRYRFSPGEPRLFSALETTI